MLSHIMNSHAWSSRSDILDILDQCELDGIFSIGICFSA